MTKCTPPFYPVTFVNIPVLSYTHNAECSKHLKELCYDISILIFSNGSRMGILVFQSSAWAMRFGDIAITPLARTLLKSISWGCRRVSLFLSSMCNLQFSALIQHCNVCRVWSIVSCGRDIYVARVHDIAYTCTCMMSTFIMFCGWFCKNSNTQPLYMIIALPLEHRTHDFINQILPLFIVKNRFLNPGNKLGITIHDTCINSYHNRYLLMSYNL